MPHVLTTCPYCGCGCGLYLQVEGHKLLGTTASTGHPVGQGRLCAKGWHAHELATSPGRLRRPLIRRGSSFEQATWDEALSLVAERLLAAKAEAGVGVLGSPRATNEENYLLAKLARAALGTNNVDFSARLDALPGLFDLPKYRHLSLCGASLDDIDAADLVFLWQSDPVEEHPAAAARVLDAAERGVPVVAVAARAGQLAEVAEMRLAPRPGSELQLAAGLLHVALAKAEPAEGDSLAAMVANCTPDQTEVATGVPASEVIRAGEALAAAGRPLVIYTRVASLGPQGADTLMALSAFGKAAGADDSWCPLLWLSSYCNFQGARDMGVVPYFLAGYQPVSEEAARAKFAQAWGTPLPSEAGLPSWEMLGRVRALFVMGDDPVSSLPDVGATREALSNIDFLVVQDIFLTPTAEAADVVLPGASFAEKDGTFTNTDRRVQRVRRASDPPGEARPDWEILCDLSRRLGRPMEYDSPSKVMDEVAKLAPIYSEISYQRLDEDWGVRWSLDGAVAADRAAFGAEDEEEGPASVSRPAAPAVDDEYPFVLVGDHSLGAWGADKLVVNAVGIRRQQGADRRPQLPELWMSRADCQERGLREGSRVRVRSRTGEVEAAVHVSDAVAAGVIALPAVMREAAAAVLPAAADSETGVPGLRPAAVSVEEA